MNCYEHLSIKEREKILEYHSQKKSQREIGRLIGRHPSTISRELQRNATEEGYSPNEAQQKYQARKARCGAKPILQKNPRLRRMVHWHLVHMWWSPEQAARRLWEEGKASISAHTIYRAIAKGILRPSIRQQLRRTKKTGKSKGPGKGPHKKYARSIHERPQAADERTEQGHLEGDTVQLPGRRAVIVTVVDRCSRMLYTALSPGRDAPSVQAAMRQILSGLPPDRRKTLTLDRGTEFALIPDLEREFTGFQCFFCDPASPRQRATNENTNGLLRQFFPKHSITFSPDSTLSTFTALLNFRPRKCLNWLSPYELFSGTLLHLT